MEAAPHPQLLVSVRDAIEAEAAIAGGADWIDLKEPAAGALGAVSAATAREVVERVAGRRPISAALGELVDWPTARSRDLLEVPEIGVVKLGLAGCADINAWQTNWIRVEAKVRAAGKSLVAVAYADWCRADAPRPDKIIELAQQTPCRYLLIDTFDKNGPNSLERLSNAQLRKVLNSARRANLRTVLAGRITHELIDRLPLELIDVVAVRGGVCPGGRNSMVDHSQVTKFRQALMGEAPGETACARRLRRPEIA